MNKEELLAVQKVGKDPVRGGYWLQEYVEHRTFGHTIVGAFTGHFYWMINGEDVHAEGV